MAVQGFFSVPWAPPACISAFWTFFTFWWDISPFCGNTDVGFKTSMMKHASEGMHRV